MDDVPRSLTRWGAMSSKYKRRPRRTASRAFDTNRDGFVICRRGRAWWCWEEYGHAKSARGRKIYGEVTGYAATSDGL